MFFNFSFYFHYNTTIKTEKGFKNEHIIKQHITYDRATFHSDRELSS